MLQSDDLMEWLGLLLAIPFAFATFCFFCVTLLYVYFDAEKRSRSRIFGLLTTLAVAFAYWPISVFAYVACTVAIDRNRRISKAV